VSLQSVPHGSARFPKAAHTVNLAQSIACRAIKAASSKATVGSAYGMEPIYPKTNSEADRAAAARYHAAHNLYFIEPAFHGTYPKAFIGEIPYEAMGFKPGDETIMKVALDWVGVHYYLRLIASDASNGAKPDLSSHDPLAQIRIELGNEGPKTDGGLEMWPLGLYDLMMQLTRDYNHWRFRTHQRDHSRRAPKPLRLAGKPPRIATQFFWGLVGLSGVGEVYGDP
jgi:beta-glucosidase